MKKIYSVQYLRAIAAIMVVHCHAIDLQQLYGTSFQEKFFYLQNFGAIGVDIFFVISGFIISYISRSEYGLLAAWDFVKRRWIRVAPAYYIASLMLFSLSALSSHFELDVFRIIKTITILPLFDYGVLFWSPILVIGWTLGFEFLFYTLNALLIVSLVIKKDLWLILIILFLFLAGIFFAGNNLQWKFITSPMIMEFAFGVLIAIVHKRRKHIPPVLSLTLVAVGIAMFLRLIISGYGEVSESNFVLAGKFVEQRLLLWGVPAMVFSAGLMWFEQARPEFIIKSRLFLLLGDASYSIYLAHPLCIALLGSLIKRVNILSRMQGDVLILLVICISVGVGILFHLYIEKPVISKLNNLFIKKESRGKINGN